MILNELIQAYQKIRPINGQVFPKLTFLTHLPLDYPVNCKKSRINWIYQTCEPFIRTTD